jgi:hypothetical protein
MKNLSIAIKFFLIVILITVECNDNYQECKKYMTSTFPGGMIDPNSPLFYTGTGIDDFGRYDGCLQSDKFKYIVTKTNVNVTSLGGIAYPIFLGLCVPAECVTKENLNLMKSDISNLTSIGMDKIDVFESAEENNKNKTFNVLKVFILVILLAYFYLASGLAKYIYDTFILKNNSADRSASYNKIHEENLEGKTDAINSEAYNSSITSINNNSKFYLLLETCFDVGKNFRKIFETRQNEDKDLKIFDGIRVITCVIIVICHVVSLVTDLPIRNPDTALQYFKSFKWQVLINAIYTVDLFFALSGFFLAYITLLSIAIFRKATFIQMLTNILLRLLRIWPAYVIVFLGYWQF